MRLRESIGGWAAIIVTLALPIAARAEAERDRFDAGGYFRVMTRPDAAGGDSKLGYWNLYGRLMNEGPWAALEMRYDMIPREANAPAPWTSLHAKIEGGSVANTDPRGGRLDSFKLTQLYVKSGNVGIRDVTWQLGTLDSYFGDLGLYDMKPAQIFFDTVGLSGRWSSKNVDLLVGAGDAGYFLRGDRYSTIFSGGGTLRARLGSHLEIGGGGQLYFEPEVKGNRFAPHSTTQVDWDYEDYFRREVAESFVQANPGQEDAFPNPVPTSAASFKAIGYVGFGKIGPIRWNSLFANYLKKHPEGSYTETFSSGTPAPIEREYTIYVHDLTDEKYQINVGNEMHVTLVPERLDMAWGLLYGDWWDGDNQLAPSDDEMTFYSTVLRLQLYLSPTVHLLGETAIAREISRNGNRYREHVDSVFQNEGGVPDTRGLEYGDADARNTWQGKVGVVLNPLGYGVFTRPSLRILYGVQYSNQTNAFGNSFVDTLDDYNDFGATENHLHHVIGAEAEAWF